MSRRTLGRFAALIIALVFWIGQPTRSVADEPAQLWRDTGLPLEQRLDDLVGHLTLEEKVRMCFGGEKAGFVQLPGVPRLNIPAMFGSDGPRGVGGSNLAFPTGIGLASAWDPVLLQEIGAVIGQEARALGKTIIFAPAFNIERDPLGGRFFEYFTEDPFLNSRLAVGFVQGMQAQKVAACIKHFAANNRDWNRDHYISHVDERTLREIYLPAFRAAVQEGSAWGVMTAANGLNGEPCSQSAYLLTDVLKRGWGFDGLVLTDFNGVYNTVPAALAGTDISMPWGTWTGDKFGKPLLDAVQAGSVPEAVVTDKARRILRVMGRVGLLDGIDPKSGGSHDTPAHHAATRRAAEESLVLLKNDGNVLPFDAAKLKQVVVVGANADRRLCLPGLGGSSAVGAPDEVTPLAGLKKRLGPNTRVDYLTLADDTDFKPISGSDWAPLPNGEQGMEAKYFKPGETQPTVTRTEEQVDFNWEMRSPDATKLPHEHFRADFEGTVVAPVTGDYTLRVACSGTSTLFLNGDFVINNWDAENFRVRDTTAHFEAGHRYKLHLEYEQTKGDAGLRLTWALPVDPARLDQQIKATEAAMRAADAVVVVTGVDHTYDSEGHDRENMDFPPAQQALIRRAVAANPHTAVVLINGSPLKLGGWIDTAPAVLEAWYPGMESGTAIAEALCGDVNPSGRLPISWPEEAADSPSHALGTQDKDNVNYTEGILVGYRYYDTKQVQPQFPFGYGLSYNHFSYKNLSAEKLGDKVQVSLDVANDGQRDGAETVQLYVAPPKSPVERPVHELKGFAKVSLQPGETRRITLTLDHDAFAYYEIKTEKWTVLPGEYTLEAAHSSREVWLKTTVGL